jgi:hyperosmotically inducible periplasmic protein
MKSTKVGCAVLSLVFVTGLAACSTTRSAGTQLSDAEITSKVKAKLASDPDLYNVASIDVDTNERVVRLSGHVDSSAEKAEAEKLARNTEDVRDVNNDIEIGGSRTLGQGIDDSMITSKVKAKLAADAKMNPFNIDVDTDHGVVTLTGRVRNPSDKTAAERLAKDTSGVREVRNELSVGAEDADVNANEYKTHHDRNY